MRYLNDTADVLDMLSDAKINCEIEDIIETCVPLIFNKDIDLAKSATRFLVVCCGDKGRKKLKYQIDIGCFPNHEEIKKEYDDNLFVQLVQELKSCNESFRVWVKNKERRNIELDRKLVEFMKPTSQSKEKGKWSSRFADFFAGIKKRKKNSNDLH